MSDIHASPDTLREDFFSRSPEETFAWGRQKGREVAPPQVIALTGSLGVGKTVLVQGLADGLGVVEAEQVCSPSYTLLNTYGGRCPLYHLDLYRLNGAPDFESIGLFDLLADEKAVVLIEWGESAMPWITHGWHIHIEDLGAQRRRFVLLKF